ncbi:unnamed protein product [Symbiodinium sp. KB8]|nr:unnamed protein product [Symbiodinium sp. KB8]
MAGKCEPQSAGPVTALGTRTGESCSWLGYCTVEHSNCKSGSCFCGRGFVAKDGKCEESSTASPSQAEHAGPQAFG